MTYLREARAVAIELFFQPNSSRSFAACCFVLAALGPRSPWHRISRGSNKWQIDFFLYCTCCHQKKTFYSTMTLSKASSKLSGGPDSMMWRILWVNPMLFIKDRGRLKWRKLSATPHPRKILLEWSNGRAIQDLPLFPAWNTSRKR